MRYRTFGRTDLEVSEIAVGCWAMGGVREKDGKPVGWGPVDDEESIRAIRRALDLGVNFFDTAEGYGLGHSEEVVGRALEGRRGTVIISSKLGRSFYDESPRSYARFSRAHHREMIEGTLKRLRTDYLDIYLWHEPVPDEILAEAAAAMEELKKDGKILCYGASAYGGDDIRKYLAGGASVGAVEPNYNLIDRSEEKGTLAVANEKSIGVIARGVLRMGALTGKFTSDSKFPESDIRSRNKKFQGPNFPKVLEVVEKMKAFVKPKRSLAQLAIQWVLGHPAVHTVIVGAKTAKQIEENAATMQAPPLTADERAAIEKISIDAFGPGGPA
ncbi:MAG: aldo/keto reductase [Planctomycetota bacterium]